MSSREQNQIFGFALVILPSGGNDPPRALGLVVTLQRRRIFVNLGQVTEISVDGAHLLGGAVELDRFTRRTGEMLASELYGRHTEDGNIVDVAISPSEYQRVGWEVSALAVSHRMSLLRRGPEIVPWDRHPELFKTDPPAERLAELRELRSADLATAVEGLPPSRRSQIAAALDDEELADLLEEMPEQDQVRLLAGLGLERSADVVEEMQPDDAADLLAEMPAEQRERLLTTMESVQAEDLRRLLRYGPETAGGLMTSQPLIVTPDTPVAEVLARVRDPDLPVTAAAQVYVCETPMVTPSGGYLGSVGFQRLLRRPPSALVGECVEASVFVRPDLPERDLVSRCGSRASRGPSGQNPSGAPDHGAHGYHPEVPMKAIQAADRGGYEALRLVDIPRPQPRAGQALVRVTSAGVTPLDRTVLAGLHPSARKLPLVPGNEGAGVVIEDPSGRFSAGERVLFFAGPGGVAEDGTFAEMTSVPSGNLAPLPGEIPDEIAGGLPVAYLSAFLALRQAGFRERQSVPAPGAGGSVGNATLKVARALGASQLVSTAGSSAKEAAAAADGGLRQVGIVNLQRESLADGLARLAPGGVDIVIDALGGPLTGQAVGGLARGGRVVVMGYAAGTETTMRVTDLVWKLAHVSGFSLFAASADEQAEAYTAVLPLIAGGQIAPAHDRSFPLEQAPEALRHLIEDRPFGTVTLTVDALSVR